MEGKLTIGSNRPTQTNENFPLPRQVFRVPETAAVLLSGGIKFSDLTDDEAYAFEENLLRTLIQIEKTFFELAASSKKNCLVRNFNFRFRSS